MKETLKAKLERLETEKAALKAELDVLYEKYYALLDNADNIAISSPAYRQLQQDLLAKDELVKSQERLLASCEKIRFQQAEQIETLHKLINERNIKNPRNAGRKPKLTEEQIQKIKKMRRNGISVREIAEIFKCSTGLISKVSSDIA